MPTERPRRVRRPFRLFVAGAVGLVHVALLLLLSTPQRPQPTVPMRPAEQLYAIAPLEPPAAPSRPRRAERPARKRKTLPAQASAAAAPSASGAPSAAPQGAPARGGPPGRDIDDPWAVQEALRGSVGCTMEELKLRPDERDRCADRIAKWAKKGRKMGPAADDPKRARELADEAEDNRQRAKWKSGYGEPGMADAALPPRSVNHPTSALDDPLPH